MQVSATRVSVGGDVADPWREADVCAWRVSCVWSGVCCGRAVVLISRGGWAKRAELGRRSHLELKRRLHLELKGVDLLFVERRQKGDDEW